MANEKPAALKDVLANPGAHFETPLSVADTGDLSKPQKKKVLDAWEEDARRLAVATEEGMAGGEPSRLTEVAEAKAKLGVEDDRRPAPTKAG
jgi:hypothetical protein